MTSEMKQGQSTDNYEMENKSIHETIKHYEHMYNIILHDKLNPKEKMEVKLAKQKHILDKFHEDRDNLISQTFISGQDRKKEIEFLKAFVDYIREKAFLENETKTIRQEMKELDQRNSILEKDIKRKSMEMFKKKAALSGVEDSPDRCDAVISTLENKLCQARMSLNQTIMTCKEYRREIDDCMTERHRFRQMLDSANAKLKLGKSCMLDMIEQAAIATSKREYAKERLKRLIEDHKYNTKKQAYIYRNLNNALSVLIDRAIFQAIKIQKRVSKDLEARKQLDVLIKRQNLENNVRKAKLLFNNLKQFYNVDTIEESIRLYKEAYGNKSSVLKYALNTFSEGDKLHKKNSVLLFECDQTKDITAKLISEEQNQFNECFHRFNELKEKVEELKTKLEYARTLKEFTILRLNMMFYKAGGSFRRFEKFLGDNTRITENNTNLMMREIEKKIIHLIGNLYLAERTKKNEVDALPLKRYLLYLPSTDENSQLKLRIFGLGIKTPCPVCAEAEHFGLRKEGKDIVQPFEKMNNEFVNIMETEAIQNRLHSVSHCHLPGSRKMLQQRFLKLGH